MTRAQKEAEAKAKADGAQKEAEAKAKADGAQKEAEAKAKADGSVLVVLKVRYGKKLPGETASLPKETAEQLIEDGFVVKA